MGTFHCPLGSPFYEGDGCIYCGLCIAESKESRIAAAEKIRTYIRSQADRRSRFRKIAVCGKGGVGKSTITVLLAASLQDMNFGVLVLDADESNPGLARLLGFERTPEPLMRGPGTAMDTGPAWLEGDDIAIAAIPSEHIVEKEGLKFMMTGKIEDPFQGCACRMAGLSCDFLRKVVPADNEIIIVDAEAGVESFGRGVERGIDTVLIVVEPSLESVAVAEKINYMADGVGVQMVKAVLNKIPSEEVRRKMVELLVLKGVSQIGSIPADPLISQSGLDGTSPRDSAAAQEMKAIVKRVLADLK
jgi:CO dehydrogenase maturation factor